MRTLLRFAGVLLMALGVYVFGTEVFAPPGKPFIDTMFGGFVGVAVGCAGHWLFKWAGGRIPFVE